MVHNPLSAEFYLYIELKEKALFEQLDAYNVEEWEENDALMDNGDE